MIGGKVQRILIISFRPDEYLSVASKKWKQSFGTSVHSIAVQLALISNGWWRYEKHRLESFAYLMEKGDKDQTEIETLSVGCAQTQILEPHR